MSNLYSLDALRADMDRQYAPVKIDVGGEELTLRNLLRLGEKDRSKVLEALKAVETHAAAEDDTGIDDLDVLAAQVYAVLSIVTADGKGKKLVAALDGDMALAMRLIEVWTEATQPGEASDSPA